MGDLPSYWLSIDNAHDGVYPFDMTHIQETTFDLIQELISLNLARYDDQTDDVNLAKK